MGALERFLNNEPERTSPLVKAALAHVQFETIHPFLDGNGRLGRLLITLLLCHEGLLRDPLLYLSLHLKQNRQQYYDLLQGVRQDGAWEAWLAFFAEAVRTTSEGAVTAARTLADLFRRDRQTIQGLGRASASALRVHEELQRRPLSTPRALGEAARLSAPTVGKALVALDRLDIVREVTGRQRDRVFGYTRYLELLAEGTEAR
jgi:Fic family protein